MESDAWYVLSDGTGFFGRQWEHYNGSLRRPRHAMGALNGDSSFTPLYVKGCSWVDAEIRSAWDLLGVHVYPVKAVVSGSGEKARFTII